MDQTTPIAPDSARFRVWRDNWRPALYVFLLWAAYVGAVQIGAHASFKTLNLNNPHPSYAFFLHHIVPDLRGLSPLARWDSIWYLSVARDGYGYICPAEHQANMAFFPLYPLLVRGVSKILPFEMTAIGVWISELSLLGTLMMIYFGFGRRWERVFGLLAFPACFMLLTFYPDSLYLSLCLGCVLLLKKERDLTAFLVAFLMGLLRPESIAFGGFLLVYFYLHRWKTRHDLSDLPFSLGAFEGLYAFMLYFHFRFGNGFLYFRAKNGFRAIHPHRLVECLQAFVRTWCYGHGFVNAVTPTFEAIFFIVIVAAAIHFYRRRRYPEVTYFAIFIASVFASGSLWGVARRGLSLFPMIELLSPLYRRRWVWVAYLGVGVALQALFIYLFATFHQGLC